MIFQFRSALLATAAAVACASPALSATATAADTATTADESSQGEIIVTAQKREQKLIDVPQSVSVLSAHDLETVHAERFADYFTRIASANIVEGQAGNTRLVLRGINTGGVGATVATYVDETPYGSATSLANGSILTPDIDPSDLQRVEVLRGPQGTLYGANSLGGLVKYVTVLPQMDAFHFSGEAGVEDVDHGNTGWVGRAAVNVPVSPDIAIRASGFYRRDPGYIDDPKLGSNVNDGKTFGGRVSVLLKPTENLTIRGTAFLENLDSNGTNEVDLDPTTLKPLADLTQSRTVRQPNDIKYRIYNATADYDFGAVNLISSTSYGTLDEAQVEDFSSVYGGILTSIFGQPLGALVDQGMRQRRFTQEVRLSSSGKHLIDWTIGGFYTHENNKLSQLLDAVDADSGAVVAALSPLETVALNSKYSEIAGFANATVHFSSQFDLTFGGRYSHNKQTNFTGASGPLAGAGTSVTGGSNANVFTFSVAPAFHPTDHMTLYARVARGYQPGGPNALPPLPPGSPVPTTFAASTTMNYEAGIKSELIDRLLTLELTAFQIDWKKIQLLAQIGGYGVNANGGKARSKGVELTSTLTPFAGLTLSASGAYIDAKLTQDAPYVGGLDGDPLPYNPHWSGTLAADYSRPLHGSLNGIFGVSWRHTGKRKSAFELPPSYGQLTLGEMDQVDAHAGVTFGNYRIDAFVRNLTDSRGISNIAPTGTAPNGAVSAAVVRPRSIGITFGVRY